jgi:hypothetical protein
MNQSICHTRHVILHGLVPVIGKHSSGQLLREASDHSLGNQMISQEMSACAQRVRWGENRVPLVRRHDTGDRALAANVGNQ